MTQSTTIKRIAAPKTWPILRKAGAFVTRPRPNGHALAFTLPMSVVLRDILSLVDTSKQAKIAMREHEISVNGKLANFGGRMMTQVSDQILGEFADNFRAQMENMAGEDGASAAPSTTPINGIVFAWRALVGFIRSFFPGKKT